VKSSTATLLRLGSAARWIRTPNLVEVFAHQGQLKGGQRHKMAGDALKLITTARGKEPAPRLVLAFAHPAMTTFFAGKSWLAAAVRCLGD
jgi:hypothetical protein